MNHLIFQGKEEFRYFCERYSIENPNQFLQDDPEGTLLAFKLFNARSYTNTGPLTNEEIQEYIFLYDDGSFDNPHQRIKSRYDFLAAHPLLKNIVDQNNAEYEARMKEVEADRRRRFGI